MIGGIDLSKYSKTYYLREKTEDSEQMQIINYCNSMSAYIPEYAMIYHIPNEGKRKNGAKLKRIGLKKRCARFVYASTSNGISWPIHRT